MKSKVISAPLSQKAMSPHALTMKTSAFSLRALLVLMLLPLTVTAIAGDSHDKHYGKAVLSNATGNGTVYLSTASGSNSGQSGSSSPGSINGTSYITWNCGESEDNDSKTYYARGTANAGYYYAGWATSNTATSYTAYTTGSTFSTSSTDSNNPTTTTIYGFFKPVEIPTVATPSPNSFAATDNATTCTDYTGSVVFTTTHATKIGDFKTPTITNKSGSGIYTVTGQTFSDNKVTVTYKFTGDGTYGGTNRSNSATITLTSYGGENSLSSSAITATFPNAKITTGTAEDIYATFNAADATQTVSWPSAYDIELYVNLEASVPEKAGVSKLSIPSTYSTSKTAVLATSVWVASAALKVA